MAGRRGQRRNRCPSRSSRPCPTGCRRRDRASRQPGLPDEADDRYASGRRRSPACASAAARSPACRCCSHEGLFSRHDRRAGKRRGDRHWRARDLRRRPRVRVGRAVADRARRRHLHADRRQRAGLDDRRPDRRHRAEHHASLSGVDPDALALLDAAGLNQAPAKLYRLVFAGDGRRCSMPAWSSAASSTTCCAGRAGREGDVQISIENAARGLGRSGKRMRTDADQRLIDSQRRLLQARRLRGDEDDLLRRQAELGGTAVGTTTARDRSTAAVVMRLIP
jgi:hypothetical protein